MRLLKPRAGLCRTVPVFACLYWTVPVCADRFRSPKRLLKPRAGMCRYVQVCAGRCRSVPVCVGLCRSVQVCSRLSRPLPVCYGLSRSVPVGARLRPKERRAMTARTTVCKRHFITYNKQTQRVNQLSKLYKYVIEIYLSMNLKDEENFLSKFQCLF